MCSTYPPQFVPARVLALALIFVVHWLVEPQEMNHSGSPRSSLKARAARARLLQDSSAGPVSSVGVPGVSPDASIVVMGPGSLPSSAKVG